MFFIGFDIIIILYLIYVCVNTFFTVENKQIQSSTNLKITLGKN